ncbi:MAG: hypothetical protein H6557_09850 [Lewinellaceae bacterium]|nr:hypothetical protein [Phaeodactylibacter sp.]MCB9036910.1 hypothetical protein [Lewinellaceae bacterium]
MQFAAAGNKMKSYIEEMEFFVNKIKETEEEVTRKCGELFDHYIKILQGFGADKNPTL